MAVRRLFGQGGRHDSFEPQFAADGRNLSDTTHPDYDPATDPELRELRLQESAGPERASHVRCISDLARGIWLDANQIKAQCTSAHGPTTAEIRHLVPNHSCASPPAQGSIAKLPDLSRLAEEKWRHHLLFFGDGTHPPMTQRTKHRKLPMIRIADTRVALLLQVSASFEQPSGRSMNRWQRMTVGG